MIIVPSKLDSELINEAVLFFKKNDISINSCAKKFGVGASTLRRYIQLHNVDTKKYPKEKYQFTRKFNYNEGYFEHIDTEEKAYWLGFIAADGCVTSKSSVLEISLKDSDKNHLEKLKQALSANDVPIYDKQVKVKNKSYHSCRLVLTSKKICRDLYKHGIYSKKSSSLKFPVNIKENLLRHYLRGYFDGDGSISTNGKQRNNEPKWAVNLVATEIFLEDFMEHLIPLGITKVSIQKKSKISSWNKTGINQISTFLNYLYKDSIVYLDRKYQLAISIAVQ